MPIYLFEAPEGVVERFFGMADAPVIGTEIVDPDDASRTIRRIPSAQGRPIVSDYAHVSSSLPRVHNPLKVAARREAEARATRDPEEREQLLKSAADWRASSPYWKNVDPSGKPVFTSKAQVEEFKARAGGRLAWSQD